MIKKLLFVTAILLLSIKMNAQIVINEVQYNGTDTIELKNLGETSVDVSGYWMCSFPVYNQINSLTVSSGSTTIPAGGLLVLTGHSMPTNGEVGLYTSAAFSSSAAIVDYVEWGSTGHTRSVVGVTAGTWTNGNFVATVGSEESIQFDGAGNTASDYSGGTPTFGSENFNNTLSSSIVSGSIIAEVFPNPTSNFVNIKVDKSNYNVTVYNLLGSSVASYKKLSGTSVVNLTSLLNGVYVLEIKADDNSFAKIKVIKK